MLCCRFGFSRDEISVRISNRLKEIESGLVKWLPCRVEAEGLILNPIDPNHDTDDIPSLEDTHDPVRDTATSMFLSHPSKADGHFTRAIELMRQQDWAAAEAALHERHETRPAQAA